MIPFKKLTSLFRRYKEIKLVYLFGSQASKRITRLSDYDVALYLEEKTSEKREKEIFLQLTAKLSLLLKTDNIDLIILNKPISPLLKFMVLKEGRLIYENEPYKILAEPAIYNEYLDFQVFKNIHHI